MSYFQVIVAGGSISGLMAARELARAGITVAVLEEDMEIGTPEHCGGLVSMEGLKNLGMVPDAHTIENGRIKHARIHSASKGFELSAENQRVVVVDRRALDKQVALQAQQLGADIRVRCTVRSFSKAENKFIVRTSEGDISSDYLIDARGVSSIIGKNRDGVLSSAQYEVFAPWIQSDSIEVVFDSEKYPGFFAWVIPIGEGRGKVGVAGRGINAAVTLKSYIDKKGPCSIVRKVYAPIWVKGPLKNFVSDRVVTVGDAAGQTKPTTAGGIYTCGMGGIMAGRAITKAITEEKDVDSIALSKYQESWSSMFGEEFSKMLLARKLLERLDNKAIDEIFSAIPKEKLDEISSTGDFDFHSAVISKLLGVRSASRIVKALFGNEIRRFSDS